MFYEIRFHSESNHRAEKGHLTAHLCVSNRSVVSYSSFISHVNWNN